MFEGRLLLLQQGVAALSAQASELWMTIQRSEPVIIQPGTDDAVAVYQYYDPKMVTHGLLGRIRGLANRYAMVQKEVGFLDCQFDRFSSVAALFLTCMRDSRPLPARRSEAASLAHLYHFIIPRIAKKSQMPYADAEKTLLEQYMGYYDEWVLQDVEPTVSDPKIRHFWGQGVVRHFRYALMHGERCFLTEEERYNLGGKPTGPRNLRKYRPGCWLGVMYPNSMAATGVYYRADTAALRHLKPE